MILNFLKNQVKIASLFVVVLVLLSCGEKRAKKPEMYEESQSDTEATKSDTSVRVGINIGDVAPEIALASPDGLVIPLSSFRGKVVMVDFWASWCGPCRGENPNNVKMYQKYKSKGFEIYGVSLDRTRDAWVAAIEQDQLKWTHVSDLGFWNSSVVPLYNITGIPATYLLDKDGKIIAKDLRGEELQKKLKEVFGF